MSFRPLKRALLLQKGLGLPLLAAVLLGAGCLDPSGTRAEREQADKAGEAYQLRRSRRELPDLRAPLAESTLVRYALQANASLEESYWQWRGALSRVTEAAAWDDPNLSFKFLTSTDGNRWDRTTLEAFQAIPISGKVTYRAREALAEAQKMRHEFEAAKFSLQRKVRVAAAEYRYLGQSVAAGRKDAALLEETVSLWRERLRNGQTAEREVWEKENERDLTVNELKIREARIPAQAAELNALLGRVATLPLPFPEEDGATALMLTDQDFFRLAAERNPELASLAAAVRGSRHALSYARRAWIPDLTLGYEVMGSLETRLTGMLSLPLQIPRILASIREAKENLSATKAALASRRDELGARLVLALTLARDTARQVAFYDRTAVPRADRILASLRSSYRAGDASVTEVIAAERARLALVLARDEAAAGRATALTELEEILTTDRSRWRKAAARLRRTARERKDKEATK